MAKAHHHRGHAPTAARGPARPDGDAAARHRPVLLAETLAFVRPFAGMRCLDATLGLGGHAEAVLQKAADAGGVELLGLDRDASALALAGERLKPFGSAVHTRHAPFSECHTALKELGWAHVDFALADIGVSSMQLDSPERGFSFREDGPLDMRMDQGMGKKAEALVNEAPVPTLMDIIRQYGEDPLAGRIARAIDDARAKKRIASTLELADIVCRAYPGAWRAKSRNHPATRTFQALRMAVNRELEELDAFLRRIVPLLSPGGRVAVITFHSLEDRMVKHFFRDQATGCRCPAHIPVCVCNHRAELAVLTKKPVCASDAESASNPRAASAKLRVAERTGSD